MFSAAEAVIEAAFAVHRKAGTFFIMKRAACPGRSSFLLQRNSSVDDLVNVCSVKQFFNKRLCDQESNSHKKRRGTETVLKDPAAIKSSRGGFHLPLSHHWACGSRTQRFQLTYAGRLLASRIAFPRSYHPSFRRIYRLRAI